MADGSTRRYHTNQMTSRSTNQAADYLTHFWDGFNLSVPHTEITRKGMGPEERTAALSHGNSSSSQVPSTADDDTKVEKTRKVVEPRKSKTRQHPKKTV
jgi:hypothetical protein